MRGQKKIEKAPERKLFSVSIFAKQGIPNATILFDFTIFPVRNSGRACPVILLFRVTLTELTARYLVSRWAGLEDRDGLTHMSGALAHWPKIPSQSPVGFKLSLSYSAALPSCPTPPHPSSFLHPRRLTCKDSTSIGTDPRAPKSSGFQLALATGGLLGGRRFRPFLFLRPWTEGA